MNLTDVVRLECCDRDFNAKSKDEALHNLAELIKHSREFRNFSTETIYEKLKTREDMGSTGFGKGIAIPHCPLENIEHFVISIAISKKGVPFDAMDNKKVKVIVTIIGPEADRNGHLKLLAQVSRILKEPEIVDSLIKAPTNISLYEEFLRHAIIEEPTMKVRGEDKLMLMIVKDDKLIQDITEIFIEYGINESTIIDTQQMENLLSKEPLFMGFFDFTGDRNPHSKVILLKLPRNRINAIITGLEDTYGDLDNFSDISVMVMDLLFSKGF